MKRKIIFVREQNDVKVSVFICNEHRTENDILYFKTDGREYAFYSAEIVHMIEVD